MRLHIILPLLLFLKFTAGASPCDPTLVKGPPGEYEFKANELTCNDDKEINIVGGKGYNKLKCEPGGWKHENVALSPAQKAVEDLTFICKAKACDESYIKGPAGDFDYSSANALQCKDKNKEIEITGRTVKYRILYCNEKHGWTDQNIPLDPALKANEAFIIACKAKDPPSSDKCVKGKITGVPPSEFTFDSNKVLKCNNNKQIMVEGNPNPFDELKCEETLGWKNGANKINIAADKDLKIACKAKANPKCAAKLIAKIDTTQDGKYDNNKLTCTDANKAIDYDKKLYAEVTCDETDGWKSGSKKFNVAADAPFYGRCVVKVCHQSLIDGFEESKMAYDSTHKLTCNDPKEAIEYTVSGKKKLADSVTCDPASKWKGQANVDTGVLATNAFAVSCVKKACHEDLVTVTDKVERTVTNELKCKQSGMKLKVDNAEYDKLICDNILGWKDSSGGAVAVKKATDRFTVTCNAAAPLTPCAIKQPVPGIIFNSAEKTLTCAPNVPAEITYQATPYDCEGFIITCDVTSGWTKETTPFAPANLPLDVTYTKYCETAEDVVYKPLSGGSYNVTCNGPAIMGYNANSAAQPVNEMTCSKADGWKKDKDDIQKPSNAVLQEFKCNKVCNKQKKPKDQAKLNATNEANWDDGLTDLAESIEEPGKVRFECNKKRIGDDKNVIILNGNLVNSHLYCDPKGGYTDFYDTKLADASATVKIACVKSLCTLPSPALCLTIESVGKMPEGHRCSGDNPSPFAITDDPNQLNCKKKGNLNRIFDHKSNPPAFIDETIVCKETDHWYKYGDSEQKAISEPDKLLCLHLRCNACQQLEGTTVKANYTPGTLTECATHNCANNFWKIKRVEAVNGAKVIVEEEYAGEVTCSAKKEFDGEWVIDENSASPTAIVEGECITSVKTCTVAAKLETACKEDWKSLECSMIALNDDNAISCPVGNMFYMQRGMANLEEGAESIKCDKTKGVWTVTRSGGNDELRRGGTVVCAKSNPAPTTTTTEAPKDPCDICPKKVDFLKICDKCEDKDIRTNKVGTKCEASVEFATVSKFETDKGTVEGKLFCEKNDYIWKDEKGDAVGKFATYKPPPNDEQQKRDKEAQTGLIVGGVVGGVVILIIIAVIIIWTIVITRRRRRAEDDKDEETKKRMLEEGKKRKKQRGDNDEILDEVSVDAPSEIKL